MAKRNSKSAGLPPATTKAKTGVVIKAPEKISAAVVLAAIQADAKPLIKRIQDYTIKNPEDFDKVAEYLGDLKKLAKVAKAKEQTITNPLNEALKETRALFKPFLDMVAGLEQNTKVLMTEFVQTQQAKSKALEAKLESGEIKKVSTLLRKQNELEVSSGHAQIRKVWTLEIVDAVKIPREYMIPDEGAIREALRGGKTVAGCVWKQTESIAI